MHCCVTITIINNCQEILQKCREKQGKGAEVILSPDVSEGRVSCQTQLYRTKRRKGKETQVISNSLTLKSQMCKRHRVDNDSRNGAREYKITMVF